MNIKLTENAKQELRRTGRKVRGGRATATEEALFSRLDRAAQYLCARAQRGTIVRSLWGLPVARWAYEGDRRA